MSTAVLITFDQSRALSLVLSNFLKNLTWGIQIFHCQDNEDYVRKTIENLDKERITMTLLPEDIKSFNDAMLSGEFYDLVPTEQMLIFQEQSCIINKELLQEFVGFDLVFPPRSEEDRGMKGMSLRNKSAMLKILSEHAVYEDDDEYEYFLEYSAGLKMPSLELSRYFSIDSFYSDNTFGCTRPWGKSYEKGFFMNYHSVLDVCRLFVLHQSEEEILNQKEKLNVTDEDYEKFKSVFINCKDPEKPQELKEKELAELIAKSKTDALRGVSLPKLKPPDNLINYIKESETLEKEGLIQEFLTRVEENKGQF